MLKGRITVTQICTTSVRLGGIHSMVIAYRKLAGHIPCPDHVSCCSLTDTALHTTSTWWPNAAVPSGMQNIACLPGPHLRLSPGTSCFLAKDPTPSAAMTMSLWNVASPSGVWHVTVTPESSCSSKVTLWLKFTVPFGNSSKSSRCRSLHSMLQ